MFNLKKPKHPTYNKTDTVILYSTTFSQEKICTFKSSGTKAPFKKREITELGVEAYRSPNTITF